MRVSLNMVARDAGPKGGKPVISVTLESLVQQLQVVILYMSYSDGAHHSKRH